MKHISLKYLAGLIDGEGCIDFQMHVDRRNKVKTVYIRPRLRIILSEPSKFLLDAIAASFGGNVGIAKKAHLNSNWHDAYVWQLEGKRMRSVLQQVIKHLFIKKEQAKFCLWWINNVMGKELNDHRRPQGSPLKQSARDEMKAMKVDPQRLSEVAVKKLKAMGYGLWSPHSNHCLSCGTTSLKHEARGYCKKCYGQIEWKEKKLKTLAEAIV